MAQTVALSATAREKTGKGAARQARFHKQVPAVIYGHGRATQPLMVDGLALEKALMGIEAEAALIRKVREGEEGEEVEGAPAPTPPKAEEKPKGKKEE